MTKHAPATRQTPLRNHSFALSALAAATLITLGTLTGVASAGAAPADAFAIATPSVSAPTVPNSPAAATSSVGFAAALNTVMPGASNTGVPIGTRLTRHYGDITIKTPGTVIDSLEIFGVVRVEAANVTIQRSIIRGRSVTGSAALVYAGAASAQNLRVVDSELAAANPSPNINGIYGSHFTLLRVNVHHVIDAVHIFGNDVTVKDSWLHDNLHYLNDPNFGGRPSHDDSIQIQRGTNLNFLNNTMSGAHNAVMQITQGQGATSDVDFRNNWVSGGACSINVAQAGIVTAPIRGLVLYQNVFGSSRFNCPIIIDRGSVAGTVFSGNLTLNSVVPKIQVR